MKISILLMFFSLISANSCKNNDAEESDMNHSLSMENELMQSMNKTNTAMNNAKMNGDFDYDFANLMIMHHQMAIDMSRVEIEKGSDQAIVGMANGIIVAQEIEIREMQQFIKNYKVPMTNNQTSNSFKIATEMKSMMDKMNTVKMTDNIDKDYVAMMIPHHESAIAMAKMQLQFGTQNVIVDLSKNIIEDQNYEIDEFKKWQTNNE
jgi:uncharacterized protein (DUF305 family)